MLAVALLNPFAGSSDTLLGGKNCRALIISEYLHIVTMIAVRIL